MHAIKYVMLISIFLLATVYYYEPLSYRVIITDPINPIFSQAFDNVEHIIFKPVNLTFNYTFENIYPYRVELINSSMRYEYLSGPRVTIYYDQASSFLNSSIKFYYKLRGFNETLSNTFKYARIYSYKINLLINYTSIGFVYSEVNTGPFELNLTAKHYIFVPNKILLNETSETFENSGTLLSATSSFALPIMYNNSIEPTDEYDFILMHNVQLRVNTTGKLLRYVFYTIQNVKITAQVKLIAFFPIKIFDDNNNYFVLTDNDLTLYTKGFIIIFPTDFYLYAKTYDVFNNKVVERSYHIELLSTEGQQFIYDVKIILFTYRIESIQPLERSNISAPYPIKYVKLNYYSLTDILLAYSDYSVEMIGNQTIIYLHENLTKFQAYFYPLVPVYVRFVDIFDNIYVTNYTVVHLQTGEVFTGYSERYRYLPLGDLEFKVSYFGLLISQEVSNKGTSVILKIQLDYKSAFRYVVSSIAYLIPIQLIIIALGLFVGLSHSARYIKKK